MASSFYRGIAFPFAKGKQSFPAQATDAALVKQSLTQIILTGRGERVMRPDFGCDAKRFIFEPDDDVLAERIRSTISIVVGRFEPRVVLQEVLVARNPDTSDIIVTLLYVLVATQTQDSMGLTFPKAA